MINEHRARYDRWPVLVWGEEEEENLTKRSIWSEESGPVFPGLNYYVNQVNNFDMIIFFHSINRTSDRCPGTCACDIRNESDISVKVTCYIVRNSLIRLYVFNARTRRNWSWRSRTVNLLAHPVTSFWEFAETLSLTLSLAPKNTLAWKALVWSTEVRSQSNWQKISFLHLISFLFTEKMSSRYSLRSRVVPGEFPSHIPIPKARKGTDITSSRELSHRDALVLRTPSPVENTRRNPDEQSGNVAVDVAHESPMTLEHPAKQVMTTIRHLVFLAEPKLRARSLDSARKPVEIKNLFNKLTPRG